MHAECNGLAITSICFSQRGRRGVICALSELGVALGVNAIKVELHLGTDDRIDSVSKKGDEYTLVEIHFE